MESPNRLNGWMLAMAFTAAVAWAAPAAVALMQDQPTLTEDSVISGTMHIDFKTRTTPDTTGKYREGSPALDVKDKYNFDISVAKTTQFGGSILRQPNIYTKTLGSHVQGAAMDFDITLAVLNPRDLKQKKAVGKWVGNVPINTQSGAYDLAGGTAQQRPLRIAVDAVGAAKAFTDQFSGRMRGKAEKKESLASYTFKRVIGKKVVEKTIKNSDPMGFDQIVLAKGPSEVYPRTTVNGRLDYDYETGNWYTDGIRFKYTVDGREFEDVITGSIKWVEDANREANGKGQYEFNLRFNEEKNRTSASEAAAFEKMSDEEAFFAVDDSVPALTGTISYVDTMVSGSDQPASSEITYNLNANKLTKQQIMNFFKLWMICVGPTNDE